MKKILKFVILLALPVIGFIGATLIPPALVHAGVAPDPTPALTTAGDASLAVWTQDGPWWFGIAVLYTALRVFLDKQHWLKQGYLLSGLTAAAGVLTAVVAWQFRGAPSAGIITALVAGITLLVHPVAAPAVPPATTDTK